MERTAFLALGANIGDTRKNLHAAVRLLRAGGCNVTAVSSLYLTKPVGMTDQPDFLNAVVEVKTALTPHDLLGFCRAIEHVLGRERTIHWGPRVIDVDILIYEGAVLDDTELVLPHPRMLERAFVLIPLAEIAPELRLADGLTASESAEQIDRAGVERTTNGSWSD